MFVSVCCSLRCPSAELKQDNPRQLIQIRALQAAATDYITVRQSQTQSDMEKDRQTDSDIEAVESLQYIDKTTKQAKGTEIHFSITGITIQKQFKVRSIFPSESVALEIAHKIVILFIDTNRNYIALIWQVLLSQTIYNKQIHMIRYVSKFMTN